MKKIRLLTALAFLFVACNNSNEAGSSASDSKTSRLRSDSLMEEVMDGHNFGMARMTNLNETKNKIQRVLDSISKLPTTVQKASLQYKMQLDSTYNWLTVAAYEMDKWMEEFNMDSAKDNEQKRVEYLESEKRKILNVKTAILGSLQKADTLLNLRR